MKKLTYIILAALAMATTGCRSHKHLTHSTANDSTTVTTTKPDEKPIRLDTIQNVVFRHYSANFSCRVDGIDVNGQIRMTHDSIIWVSINKIIELGRVVLTPTRVQGYVKIMDKYFDGTYDELRKRWGIDIDYATMEALLLGNCPAGCSKTKEPKRDNDTVTLWYSQKSTTTGQQRQLTLKKGFKSKRLLSAEATSPTPKQQIKLKYSNVTNISGQLLPSTIDVEINSTRIKTTTQLTLTKTTVNKPQSYPFSIPKRYKKI